MQGIRLTTRNHHLGCDRNPVINGDFNYRSLNWWVDPGFLLGKKIQQTGMRPCVGCVDSTCNWAKMEGIQWYNQPFCRHVGAYNLRIFLRSVKFEQTLECEKQEHVPADYSLSKNGQTSCRFANVWLHEWANKWMESDKCMHGWMDNDIDHFYSFFHIVQFPFTKGSTIVW